MLWVALAIITAAALGALLVPLWQRETTIGLPRGEYDRSIYRHQLAALEAEAGRGMLSPTQLADMRLEIQRRMLATDTAEAAALATPPATRRNVAALALGLALAALLLYALLGAPQLGDNPYATRATRDPYFAVAQQVALLAEKLKHTPDAQGFNHLGEGLMLLRRFDGAAEAYRQSIARGKKDAETWARLGESLVMQHEGTVVMEAKKAFRTALKNDPNDPRAQFYTGLSAAQENKVKEALAIWQTLLKNSPADAPWVPMVNTQMARYADPKRAMANAVLNAAPAEQSAMIRGMVAKLEAKLAANPNDAEGWEMLARSYATLGEPEKSKTAAQKAIVLRKKE